jgi:hypothetical protein
VLNHCTFVLKEDFIQASMLTIDLKVMAILDGRMVINLKVCLRRVDGLGKARKLIKTGVFFEVFMKIIFLSTVIISGQMVWNIKGKRCILSIQAMEKWKIPW